MKIKGVEDFRSYGKSVLAEFEKRAEAKGIQQATPSYEGIRLVFPGEGWVLLRMSLHDPNMPMNMESTHEGGCEKLTAIVKDMVSGFEHLDISVLG